MHIDAEVHFWKYEMVKGNLYIRNRKILAQDYLPDQIEQSLHRNGMAGCLAVVAADLEVETRFLSELAETHPEIKGVIGWLDLTHPKAVDKIQEFREYPPIKGYRLETLMKEVPDSMVMESLLDSQYCLDLAVRHHTDISKLSSWVKAYPEQQFILQNCGNASVNESPAAGWENQIRELAKNQNLSCKVSGLLTSSDSKSWRPADFYPFLEILFDAFGAGRLLFASDWPFLLVAGMYVQWKSLLEKFTERYTQEDRDLFFGENAQRIYRL
jgi:L-fuconolactonase